MTGKTATPTRRELLAGLALGAVAVGAGSRVQAEEEIYHAAESIHQETRFKASPESLYAVLTDAKQFQKVVLLSGAVKEGMVKAPAPAAISAVAGGEFSLFGGYISGRQIELLPNVRIVQAWRTGSWDPGTFSIVRMVLTPQAGETLLTLDHTGFPKGEAEHLARGWKSNYWEPLEKVLARTS